MTTETLTDHPYAAIWPMMSPEEASDLDASLKSRGLIEEIVLAEHEGQDKIADGRNRYHRCLALGIEPRFRWFGSLPTDGADLLDWIEAKNTRRNLDPASRAMVAARLIEARGRNTTKQPVVQEVADKHGVGKRTVERALEVLRTAEPEVVAAVDAGELSLNEAEYVAAATPEEQKKAADGNNLAELARLRKEREEEERMKGIYLSLIAIEDKALAERMADDTQTVDGESLITLEAIRNTVPEWVCSKCLRMGPPIRMPCDICTENRKPKSKEKPEKAPPTAAPIELNPDADIPPELLDVGDDHVFSRLYRDTINLAMAMTKAINGTSWQAEKLRRKMTALKMVDYAAGKKPRYIGLAGMPMILRTSGEEGAIQTDAQIIAEFETACGGGKPPHPAFHINRKKKHGHHRR